MRVMKGFLEEADWSRRISRISRRARGEAGEATALGQVWSKPRPKTDACV